MSQPDTTTSGLDDPTAVVRSIVNRIADTEVELEMSFFDLGLDSIQLLDVCNQINDHYGEVIDLFLLFENPTIQECAQVVAEHHSAQPG